MDLNGFLDKPGHFLASLADRHAARQIGYGRCETGRAFRDHDPILHQLNRTYSKSTGCRLIPITGGAIQLANLPGSTTRPIRLAT